MARPPNVEQLEKIARRFGLHLEETDLLSFLGLMEGVFGSYRRLDELTEPALPVRYPRAGGYRPEPEENPLGAWYWRCSIKGASSGLLAGRRS